MLTVFLGQGKEIPTVSALLLVGKLTLTSVL